MKAKFGIVMVLIGIAVAGILVLQSYWSISAYSFNKTRFDYAIDTAISKAIEDCKKDYFDSIRVVIVKRLSQPDFKIRVDTVHEADSLNEPLAVWLSTNTITQSQPYQTLRSRLDYYRLKIPHRATLNELITEASFYQPQLLSKIVMLMNLSWFELTMRQPRNLIPGIINITQLPPDVRAADSLRISRHLRRQLNLMHIGAPFKLVINDQPEKQKTISFSHSETNQFVYKFHGFTYLNIKGPVYYVKAVFPHPQYSVLGGMWLSVLCSGVLLLFMLFSFYYIVRTLMLQKKLSEMKDDFISNMAHELKTPLATMTVAIEGLQNFNALHDPEKTHRYLQASRDQLGHLNNLVNRVLDVASYEKQGMVLNKAVIDVDRVIEEVIAAEKLIAHKKVSFVYHNTGLGHLYTDKFHFRNVVTNLIDNAIKYTVEAVEITISCSKENNDAVISIKDNGIGIPQASLPYIFDKFYRVPTGNLYLVKGTGLGLSYVKSFVEAHGGIIEVKSTPNAGSTFTLSIPLSHE